jgi:non-specific serine/threonine protein kinase
VAKRKQLIDKFQGESYCPFMVLSLKAGGVGLNLTRANHVVHFDRWWNPAVENQATDRAFRIGQTKKVLVHKFVTRGTIEEKIDQMISEKQALADTVVAPSGETLVTEMDDKKLMDLFRLSLPE